MNHVSNRRDGDNESVYGKWIYKLYKDRNFKKNFFSIPYLRENKVCMDFF